MKRPIIGVSTDITIHQDGTLLHTLRAPYAEAIRRAGGSPLLLPSFDPENTALSLDGIDGLLMTGGDDLDPVLYGARERHPEEVPLHPLREGSDLVLLKQAIERGIPLLCICLGFQEMAVAFGGTLHQFIPDSLTGALEHRSRNGTASRHDVALEEGTFLHRVLGPRIEVNSMHRQGVSETGARQIVAARSPDGVIEAIESQGPAFAVGVQWHPELILDEAGQLDIFRGFIEACLG
jgi:putative glutamine amidotransferase